MMHAGILSPSSRTRYCNSTARLCSHFPDLTIGGAGARVLLGGKPGHQRKDRFPLGIRSASDNCDARIACRSLAGDEGESTPQKACPAHHLSRVASEDTFYLLIQINVATLERQALLEYDGPELTERLALLRDQMERAQAAMSKLQPQRLGYGKTAVQLSDYLALRRSLKRVVSNEDFRTAAALQQQLESMMAISKSGKSTGRPIFRLGELVQHNKDGYCGTAIGWLTGCPEGTDWRESAGYGGMLSTESDIWYYVLVNNISGEPKESGLVPVALVPERCLSRLSHSGEFSRTGASAQSAAVLEALFLGFNDDGQLVPCQQLKDRFDRSTQRVPSSVVGEAFANDGLWQGLLDEDVPDELPLYGRTFPGSELGEHEVLYGKDYIPGIDMSSLAEDGKD